jgi:hypothetical protein
MVRTIGNKQRDILSGGFVCFVLILFTLLPISCMKDDNLFVKSGPAIEPLVTVKTFVQERGLPVELAFELKAINGLKTLEITKDNEPYDLIDFLPEQLLETYVLNYLVEEKYDNGDTIVFGFTLTDQQEQATDEFLLNIKVGPPFEIRDTTINRLPVKQVTGRINRSITLRPDTMYLFNGLVSVEGNKTLTIEPGTTILMKTFSGVRDSRLAITQGSKLNAVGTKDHPIIFTSADILTEGAGWGDWGGIFLYGYAPTNQAATIFEEGFVYGGTNERDDSGSLEYIRIEHAGKNGADAIQFYGVGSGTDIRYLNVYNCLDNGVRFKGGNASIKYMVVIEHGGYGFWAEHGWKGKGQFWVFQTSIPATIIPVNFWNQARSLELRNDRNNFLLQPATYTTLSNITMIGNGNTDLDGTRRGFRIRRGAMGIIQNMIVTNFPDDGVRVEDVPPEKISDGTMVLDNTRSFSNRSNFDEQAEDIFLAGSEYNVSEIPVEGIDPDNFAGSVPSNFDPATASGFGSWFSPAPFIGAIENADNDWTKDGFWCRGQDGSIR